VLGWNETVAENCIMLCKGYSYDALDKITAASVTNVSRAEEFQQVVRGQVHFQL
jgi:hypothetical protein